MTVARVLGKSALPPLVLWSASNMLKYKINRTFFEHHYVWCSPVFEAAAMPRGALGADQPKSSDPASIYRALFEDVKSNDKHSAEIARQRDGLKAVALLKKAEGSISDEEAAEIGEMADLASIYDFRPVLYVIPYEGVANRVSLVKGKNRASIEPEYLITELKDDEFEMIELFPCR